jgi:hypothetical protein
LKLSCKLFKPSPDEDELIIQVFGTPDAQMAGMNVLLLA